MSTNYGYDCTAEEHTECDPDYCDFAYEQMLEDDGSVQPFDDGLEQEYDYLVPEENLYESKLSIRFDENGFEIRH